MIKIYDTMSRDLREFIPIEEGKVRMYVCGPTVYNYIHVGNARSTVAFDTIRRYFEYRGYEVATFPTLQMWMIRSSTVPKKKASHLRKWQTSTLRPFVRM